METEVLQKKLLKYWRILKSIFKKVNVLMKFLAIIPARKNSKGIKNKNLKNLIKNHSFIGLYKLQIKMF